LSECQRADNVSGVCRHVCCVCFDTTDKTKGRCPLTPPPVLTRL
jgi:hypothetical protein